MVDRALHLLSLHVIWKARNLVQNASATGEDQLQESLREERDILLEKLVEYAIGTHSNTLLGIRRAVGVSSPCCLYYLLISCRRRSRVY